MTNVALTNLEPENLVEMQEAITLFYDEKKLLNLPLMKKNPKAPTKLMKSLTI